MVSSAELTEALLVGVTLRVAFYYGCRRYVRRILTADIRQAINETGTATAASGNDDSSTNTSPISTPTRMRGFNWQQQPSGSLLPTTSSPARLPVPPRQQGQQQAFYPRLASFVFCASFADSCMLFALVIFGNALGDRARHFNWNFSLGSLLALIVLVTPLGQCLLVTYRNRSSTAALSLRIAGLTAVLFGGYLFCFLQIGDYLSSILGVSEGSGTLGLFANVLERICVPGTILIASLSGFGAVNTAWEAVEWRKISKRETITENSINTAERALQRARADLQDRKNELDTAENAAKEAGGRSLLGRMLGGGDGAATSAQRRSTSPRPRVVNASRTELSALRQEVAGMEAMEAQMVRDLATMRSRKTALDLSRTWHGKLWQAFGVGFALYCVVRIILSGVNLVFGYSRVPTERGGVEEDLASQLVRQVVTLTGLSDSIDAARWSPVVGLALVGSIIVANLRSVLSQVSRVLHATSAAVSASFLLLCLAQLMAIYLVTSLVALPPPETGSVTADLLKTLPAFAVYSKLFDGVFLAMAIGTLVVRWLERRLRADDLSSQGFGMETFGRGDDGRGFV